MSDFDNLGAIAARPGDAESLALIDLSGGTERRFAFGDLDRMADAVARGLLAKGLVRGQTVGIAGWNSAEFLAAYLGILKVGMVAVPVNPRLPAETLGFVVQDAALALVFADKAAAGRLPADLPAVLLDGAEDGFAGFLEPGGFQPAAVRDDDAALILYTSGSTGRPKGVVLSHGSQLSAVRSLSTMAPLIEGNATIVAAPLFHMNALASCHAMFSFGGRVVLLPRFEAASYIRAIDAYRAAMVSGVPTMIALIAREQALLRMADLTCVRLAAIGSAPMTASVLRQIREIFPNTAVTNSYGTTEIGPAVFGPHPQGLPRPPLSIGHPQPGYDVRLVGATPTEGVLEVRGPSLMTAYKGRPELTAECFRSGFYHTGDIMRRDEDGFFYFVGRADDMFVCAGENIYPQEVEALLEAHPDILEVAVVPADDPVRGQIPVAFIVVRPGAALTEDEVKGFALAKGPPHLHPRRVHLLDALPLAGPGKVDRQLLKQRV